MDSTVTPVSGEPRIAVGTSGFAYEEWRSIFYPDDLPAKRFLAYYGERLPTTEINSTYYRFPRATVAEGWAREVPENFTFTLKMSQRLTHVKRLKDVDREMTWFCDGAYALGPKLGAVLVQLPPNFKADVPRLEDFLARHAKRLPMAVEFRHASWLADATYDVLRQHGAALAVIERDADDPIPRPPRLATAPFVYVRLRKVEYTDAELGDWADWMRAQSGRVFCYLKHQFVGPLLAQRLLVHLGILPALPAPPSPAAAPEKKPRRRTKRTEATDS